MKTKRREWIYLFVCLFLGIIAELSFLHGTIGVSYILFIAVFYTVLFARFRFSFEHRRIGLLLMAGIWILSVSFLFYDSTVLYYLNIFVIPIVIFFHIVLITSPSQLNWGKLSFIRLVTGKLLDAFQYLINYIRYIGRQIIRSQRRMTNRIIPQIVVGVLVAIPLLMIIISLLTSADAAFQQFVERVFFIRMGINIIEIGFRVAFVLIATLFFFCVFQVIGKRTKREIRIQHVSKRKKWNGVILLTVLLLVNTVYLTFIVTQFNYFFHNGLYTGVTYADYARRGFYELLIVSFLNLILLLICIKRAMAGTRLLKRLLQTSYSILVVSSGVLLVSVWQRFILYEEMYGFTIAGALATYFMLFLLVLFAYMLFRIWLENLPILHFYLISAFVFYTMLNVVNIEGIVVENNIERYEETGKIDIYYLDRMGAEGVRGLIYLYEENSDIPEVEALLVNKKVQMEEDGANSFQSYNFVRNEAKELLQELALD